MQKKRKLLRMTPCGRPRGRSKRRSRI